MPSVLFIASHRPGRAPGQRFRFEQYFSYLEQHGYRCHLSYLLDEEDDKLLYTPGHVLQKAKMLCTHYLMRWRDLQQAENFDIIFIFREALMTRSLFFEKRFAKTRAKIIFDFDDAIWMNDTSRANRLFRWMKNPSKISRTIAMSDLVFAGNHYLAEYARKYNTAVAIVPTTINTDEYSPALLPEKTLEREGFQTDDKRLVIGWSGSLTTIKHFEYAIPILTEVKKKLGERIHIKLIGDANYRNETLGISGIAWSKENEVKELSEIDIGIMPLPDDEWARGKCGLKGLQYMSLGIATVMSPVGVNRQIIQHGINGFLAETHDQYVEIILQLAESEKLRKMIGTASRKTVEDHYSLKRWAPEYLRHFNQLLA